MIPSIGSLTKWNLIFLFSQIIIFCANCSCCSVLDPYDQVQQVCKNCGVCMGAYFCGVCKLFDDDVSENVTPICFFEVSDVVPSIWNLSVGFLFSNPMLAFMSVTLDEPGDWSYDCTLLQTSKKQYHCDGCGICRYAYLLSYSCDLYI